NRALKVRLTAFAMVIVALAAAIGFAAYASWREVGRLQTRLSTGHLRSFEIADHLQAAVLELHDGLLRYNLRQNLKDRIDFERNSDALNRWIDEQKPALKSAHELELLNQIDATYDVFLAAGTNHWNNANMAQET